VDLDRGLQIGEDRRFVSDDDVIHPTLLMVGEGEPMDAALRVALDRHGLHVEECVGDVKSAVRTAAPDVVFLVGNAAADGGRAILDVLAIDPVTNVVPVIVLGHAEKLDSRLTAFRAGAVAVVPRTASADQIATRVAEVTRELGERSDAHQDALGEATFDELVSLVAQELRSGILSVGRANKPGEPMRIVLGAGRPVADAVEEFVRKLRPLVSRAEPLVYELHASTGGPVGLFDPEPGSHGDLGILKGLRVILVDGDASRADTLAQQLRAQGSTVAVADPSARGLERARGLDPEVVIVDAAGIEGPGFEVVRAIRSDVRLRWAAMLVAPWADIWPESAHGPDLAELVERIRPLVVHDHALRDRALAEASFDTRLEATGPSRLLRVLASLPGPFHVSLRNRKATVELDIAEGLVVGARATRAAGDVIEGTRALAAMLVMASSRVHIERRTNPSIANLMAPVEEALAQASKETAPIPMSAPPPPIDGGRAGAKKPFPTASEVGRSVFEDDADSSGPRRPPPQLMRTRASVPKGETNARDLRWAESEVGEGPKSQTHAAPSGLFSNNTPSAPPVREPALRPRAALSAFGETKPLFPDAVAAPPEKPEDSTRIYASDELARASQDVPSSPSSPASPDAAANLGRVPVPPPTAPAAGSATASRPGVSRKATLVMGAHQSPLPPPAKAPAARPPLSSAPRIQKTLTMGTAETDALPPPASEPPIAAARFPAPGVLDPLGTTAVPTVPSKTTRNNQPRTLLGVPKASPNIITSDYETLSADAEPGTDPNTVPFGDRTDPNTAPFRPELDPRTPGAPQLPASAIVQPSAARQRVLTPMLASSATPFAGDAKPKRDVSPPQPPPPVATPQPPSARSSPGTHTASLAPPDPAPLGVISAPVPPSGIAQRSSMPPAPAAPSESPLAPAPPVSPVARAPRRSTGRGFAWLLVALGAAALVGVAGWIGWTRYGGALLAAVQGSGPPIVVPLAGADASSVDAASAVDAATLQEDAAVLAIVPADAIDAAVAVEVVEEVDAAVEAPAPEVDAAIEAVAPVEVETPVEVAPGDETAEQLVARAEASPDAAAEALYRRALTLDPRNHYAMLGLAGILMRRGAPAEAIPFIESAIRRRGRRAEYRVLLGDARRDAGDLEGARAAWREALEIDPDDRDAHTRLGD
jgi:DNA-binding response OmpR family regulator